MPSSEAAFSVPAEVVILDDSWAPSGATVTGKFSEDIEQTVEATTDSNGLAVLETTITKTGRLHITFFIDDVELDPLNYDANADVESCDKNY